MAIRFTTLSARNYAIGALILMLAAAGICYATWEARACEVTTLSIPGAPEGIVFIADPHVRPENLDHIREVIREINNLHPSVVLIGGDFGFHSDNDLSLQGVWGDIDAPVYAVLGNHDYQSGMNAHADLEKMYRVTQADLRPGSYNVSNLFDENTNLISAAALEEVLEKKGIIVLRNEYVALNVSGRPLIIVGVDDCWAGMAKPPKIPDTDAFTIYMIHEPDCRADWDADLILAGHTHGGQFSAFGLQVLNDLGVVELSGYVSGSRIPVYITRGIGTSNLPWDLRLGAPPEIVIINPASPENPR